MVTRKELEAEYEVDARGIVRSLGKFEGEPLYVPYFWFASLEGAGGDEIYDEECEDCDRETCSWDHELTGEIFEVQPEDVREFPELEGVARVELGYRSDGFVVLVAEYGPNANWLGETR